MLKIPAMDVGMVVEQFGGTSALAVLCEVEPSAVSQWKAKNRIPRAHIKFLRMKRPDLFPSEGGPSDEEPTPETIPAEQVIEYARSRNFDVTPHQLRPDLYPHPEDGLPPLLRSSRQSAAPLDDLLERLNPYMTEAELRELTEAIEQGPDVAFGYVKGLAEKYRVQWNDTVLAQCVGRAP
jgi:DNA-binding transcriptional regulator YdaS (Cro superfamily)